MFDFDNFETVLIGEFRNFVTQIAQGSLEKMFNNESEQVGGFVGWKLTLQRASDSGGTFIVPSFSWPKWYFFSILNVRILINPLNHLNSENKEFKYADRFYYKMGSFIEGKKMYLSEILDEKNGWLDNGAFTVKVGFYVESMLDKQGVWRFNFLNDPIEMKSGFDSVNLFREDNIRKVMCHIQLLKLHCKNLDEKLTAQNGIHGIPYFDEMKACLDILHGVQLKYPGEFYACILKIAKFLVFSNVIRYIELQIIEDPREKTDILLQSICLERTISGKLCVIFRYLLKLHCKNLDEKLTAQNGIHGISDFGQTKACLDILHGVQLKYPDDIFARILKIAKFLEFSNVIRYIELQIIEDPRGYKEIGDWILFAIQSNFNRLLTRLLEKLEDLSVLEEVMKKVDIQKMSGESMKICVKKLLYDSE